MRFLVPVRSLLVVAALALVATPPSQLQAQDVQPRSPVSLTIGGRFHAQYAASSVEAAENDLFLRRARLTFDVRLTDRIDGRIQPDYGGGDASLKDAYMRVRLAPELRVSVGQFKRAFDPFFLASSTDLSLVERDGRIEGLSGCGALGGTCSYSRVLQELELTDRDRGVRLDGSRGRVSWLATITNGTGANASDENDAKSYSGRVSLGLTDALTVSGQLAVHDYVTDTDPGAYAQAWGVDVEHGTWRDGVLFQAAVAGGENWRADSGGESPDFLVAQAAASVYVPVGSERSLVRGLEPLARVSWADPNRSVEDDGGLMVTPGLMFYMDGKTKIGANVDVFSPQTGDTEWSLKLQTFLYF